MRRILLAGLHATLCSTLGAAETVYLLDGSKLNGSIQRVDSETIELNTPDGLLSIKKSRIKNIDYQESPTPTSAPLSEEIPADLPGIPYIAPLPTPSDEPNPPSPAERPRPKPGISLDDRLTIIGSFGIRLESSDGDSTTNSSGFSGKLGFDIPVSPNLSLVASLGMETFDRETLNGTYKHAVTVVPIGVGLKLHSSGDSQFFLQGGLTFNSFEYKVDPSLKQDCLSAGGTCNASLDDTVGTAIEAGIQAQTSPSARVIAGIRRSFLKPQANVEITDLSNGQTFSDSAKINLSSYTLFIGFQVGF